MVLVWTIQTKELSQADRTATRITPIFDINKQIGIKNPQAKNIFYSFYGLVRHKSFGEQIIFAIYYQMEKVGFFGIK